MHKELGLNLGIDIRLRRLIYFLAVLTALAWPDFSAAQTATPTETPTPTPTLTPTPTATPTSYPTPPSRRAGYRPEQRSHLVTFEQTGTAHQPLVMDVATDVAYQLVSVSVRYSDLTVTSTVTIDLESGNGDAYNQRIGTISASSGIGRFSGGAQYTFQDTDALQVICPDGGAGVTCSAVVTIRESR